VVADGGSWKPGLERVLTHVDVLVVSGDFRRGTDDEQVDLGDLLALGPRWVARTAGRDPVLWLAADGSSGSVPVHPTVVVDTLGAGDVLHGALVADVARHGTGDLPASLARSVELATTSVAAPGARGWAGVTARRGS
jgi:sugar/nucleoside kinase (ribokinase family)